jgi:Tol biopolymer transport system component
MFAAGSHLANAGKTRTGKPAAKRASAAAGAPLAGRIAFIGEGANLYVCGAACEKPTCITCAAKAEHALAEALAPVALNSGIERAAAPAPQYELPTFSPDGTQIAYSSVQRGRDGVSFGINAYDLNRRAATVIFQSSDRPIYFFWLPDGRRLFFLASDGESLKLILAQAREAMPVRILLTGLPLFFDWKEASSDLAFHYVPVEGAGPEQVGLMGVTDRDQRVVKAISKGKAPFRGPAWSPDGSHLAYVIDNKNGQSALMVANADGSAPKPMVGLAPSTTAFVWAPDSGHIAFSTLKQQGKMSYDGVNLLDIGSGNISTLVSDPVIAYNFSPNGRWLAYIGTTETSNTWNVIAAGGGKPRRLCSFVATGTESIVYQVFDQYALSHRFWSPDSRALVFAGVILKEGQAPAEQMPPPSVWVLPLDGGPPRTMADGSIAFWSPR